MLQSVRWSKTRIDCFNSCQRAYWYSYYGARKGWRKTAGPDSKEIYILKNLSSRWSWVGSGVHDTIAEILTEYRDFRVVVPFSEAKQRLTSLLTSRYWESRNKEYWHKKAYALAEHEYDIKLPVGTWASLQKEAVQCLENFYSIPLYTEIYNSNPKRWQLIDTPQRAMIGDTPAWFTPDFAFDNNGVCRIIDWKCGKDLSKSAEYQLVIYSTFANKVWGYDKDKISLVEAKLLFPKVLEYEPPSSSDYLISSIKSEYLKLLTKLQNPEVDDVSKDTCPPTVSNNCTWCNFRKLCMKDGTLNTTPLTNE